MRGFVATIRAGSIDTANAMQPLRRRLVATLTGLCLLLYLPAAGALTYLSAADLDLRTLLPSPPAADSAAQLADLAAVLAAQESRTAAQAEFARADAQVSVFRFADVLGPAFSEEQLPLTAALFRQLGREVVAIGRVAKVHWSRPRPYRASELVKPLLAPSSDGSYPSGHSLFGYLSALLLAQIARPPLWQQPLDRRRALPDRCGGRTHRGCGDGGAAAPERAVSQRLRSRARRNQRGAGAASGASGHAQQ